MGPVLVELRVRNLGVIDDVTVALGPGMTALTGETGAGKTLLVGALGLLLGGRADPSVVRAGADEALVEGRFDLPDRRERCDGGRPGPLGGPGRTVPGLDRRPDGVARGAGRDGRRTDRAPRPAPAPVLVHADAQRQALDAFGAHRPLRPRGGPLPARALSDESRSLGGDARERAREVDLLRFQVAEIDACGHRRTPTRTHGSRSRRIGWPRPSSHREAAAAALVRAGRIGRRPVPLDRLAEASGALAGRPPLAGARRSGPGGHGRARPTWPPSSGRWSRPGRTTPTGWTSVRPRRQLLHELERKYGDDLGRGGRLRRTTPGSAWPTIEDDERRAAGLDEEIRAARPRVEEAEAEVGRRPAGGRAPAGRRDRGHPAHDLAMPSARFAIDRGGTGAGRPGDLPARRQPRRAAQPLAKVASGGELARTMLAVRLAITDAPGVMVFDEVDAGVGGAAATAVGAALAGLGRHGQVLVVTHLAQVAAQADHQLAVRKIRTVGGGPVPRWRRSTPTTGWSS